ncbi:glycosyltransferase family 2 protein [Rhodopirellula sp. P2]|uniref:glycosyltransferase family 2 protein n=1 Tax=Rhodopirellula sp. P2 TaxID=2127060 RepID=UPI002367E44E|nr:glycosyltransferase family 2 protein [Rhodopirellula sp. P2]WDQ15568.1 glycosyltransferase family 2 protein [Rhodopirellula sp. P2]
MHATAIAPSAPATTPPPLRLLTPKEIEISLVLPAFNESAVIATAIDEASSALSGLATKFEIIVVDDGSSDETAKIVREIMTTNDHVRIVQHRDNQGYGAAIRSGFAAANHALVVFTDADCQFDLTELDRFALLSERYDIVCGYRIDRQDTSLRCFYSKVYNSLSRILLGTGVRDVDCALKMFHRDQAQQLQIHGNGFLVNSEILLQARQEGRQVIEVGVSHRPRTLGESTVSVRHIPRVLMSLIGLWWNKILCGGPPTRARQNHQPSASPPFGLSPSIISNDVNG